MITTTVPQIRASPPMAPPTMAPIGVEECDEVVEDDDATEPVDVPEESTTIVVAVESRPDVVAGVSPGGYCVPVLMPLAPVKIGRSTSSICPV
jgi:hypothetical protein